MAVETRAYDNAHGEPVVVLVVKGDHDVSRLVNLLERGNCEQVGYGAKLRRQLRRHNGGRAAFTLLREHGGVDFSGPDEETLTLLRRAIFDPGQYTNRRRTDTGDFEELFVIQARAAYAALFGEEAVL